MKELRVEDTQSFFNYIIIIIIIKEQIKVT